MKFLVAGHSEKGPRPQNEDAWGVRTFGDGTVCVAIADGVGGQGGGLTAANYAVTEFLQYAEPGREDLSAVAFRIHEDLTARQNADDPSHAGGATTLTAARFFGGVLSGIHVGDTRAMIFRQSGARRLTEDQTEAVRLLKAGKLTEAEAKTYVRKHVLDSALGARFGPRVESFSFSLMHGDRILFTTDGLHNKVFLREMAEISMKALTVERFISDLMQEAEKRNPEDNFSAVCVEVRER
ncbi:MAG: serine/threonine-protein phosphatase [Alphaproteobacteria bacterium]|nr:serine/threonine-protein phosphatase [Alphaproteobacteria bacterium]